MADYRDPKVTKTRDKRGMGTWIGVLVAAVLVIGLIWWWAGGDYETAAVVEPVAPAAEEGAEVEVVPVEPVQE